MFEVSKASKKLTERLHFGLKKHLVKPPPPPPPSPRILL